MRPRKNLVLDQREAKVKLTLAIGRVYLVTKYHTGDFRGKCCGSLKHSAQFKVTDPMKSGLKVDDELEISFTLADFLPAIIEDFKSRRA